MYANPWENASKLNPATYQRKYMWDLGQKCKVGSTSENQLMY